MDELEDLQFEDSGPLSDFNDIPEYPYTEGSTMDLSSAMEDEDKDLDEYDESQLKIQILQMLGSDKIKAREKEEVREFLMRLDSSNDKEVRKKYLIQTVEGLQKITDDESRDEAIKLARKKELARFMGTTPLESEALYNCLISLGESDDMLNRTDIQDIVDPYTGIDENQYPALAVFFDSHLGDRDLMRFVENIENSGQFVRQGMYDEVLRTNEVQKMIELDESGDQAAASALEEERRRVINQKEEDSKTKDGAVTSIEESSQFNETETSLFNKERIELEELEEYLSENPPGEKATFFVFNALNKGVDLGQWIRRAGDYNYPEFVVFEDRDAARDIMEMARDMNYETFLNGPYREICSMAGMSETTNNPNQGLTKIDQDMLKRNFPLTYNDVIEYLRTKPKRENAIFVLLSSIEKGTDSGLLLSSTSDRLFEYPEVVVFTNKEVCNSFKDGVNADFQEFKEHYLPQIHQMEEFAKVAIKQTTNEYGNAMKGIIGDI